MRQKRITVITGSRADWGLLFQVCKYLKKYGNIIKVLAVGAHVDKNKDYSINEVKEDATNIEVEVEMVYIIPDNAKISDKEYIFKTFNFINDNLPSKLKETDLVVLLGDRYEIFASASICRLIGMPIVHFCGGELTLGAFDDALRHCITKLSDYHFVSNEEHYQRVRQLGENPKNIFDVGDLGINELNRIEYKNPKELSQLFSFSFVNFFLITVHPETCNKGRGLNIVKSLLKILPDKFGEYNFLFTAANADPEGEEINRLLSENKKIKYIKSLGRINYLSAVKLAKCVIGNSSSGILEVPALHTPVVNIGNRQKGRKHCDAVIDADYSELSIIEGINKALLVKDSDFKFATHGLDSAQKSAEIITNLELPKNTEKVFYDLP